MEVVQTIKKIPTTLLAGIFFVVASVVAYFVSTKFSPNAFPVAVMYFVIVVIVGFALILSFVILAAKWAKIEQRTFDKALLATSGTYLINSLFSIARIPFAETNKGWGALCWVLVAVLSWFFFKKVYGISHRQTGRFAFRLAIIVGALAVVLGLLGSWFFGSKID